MSSIPIRTQHRTLPSSFTEHRDQPSSDDRSAEWLLGRIHEHLRAGQIRIAQSLARDAATRYPEDPEVKKACRILFGGEATSRPKTGRSLRDEYRWLKSPPDEYRGRWVALIGEEVVAVADTLAKLREVLPSNLERTPLVVQVSP